MSLNFKVIDAKLCISVRAIAEALGAKTSYFSVTNALLSFKDTPFWKTYADESDSRKKWIVIETLPESTRLQVEAKYGQDLWLAYYTERLYAEVKATILISDEEYFLSMRVRSIDATSLSEAASWLRIGGSDYWKGKWTKRSLFWGAIVSVVSTRNLKGFRVSNTRVFERRLKRFDAEGLASLLPGYIGNSNAQKASELARKRIVHLYSNSIKPTVEDVTRIFNQEALANGWPQLSYERVRQIIQQSEFKALSYLARHGKDAAKNLVERTIKRRRPSFPDALWIGDGSTIQLYYSDGKGQIKSDLYAYVVVDAYSHAIIGAAVGQSETGVLVQAAYRDAVRRTGMMPYQIQYDNSSANKGSEAQQVFDKLAHLHFPTAPYNGKAKVIEAIWGRLEQYNLHHFANFKGGNITAKSLDARANPDALSSIFKTGELPSLAGAVAQFRLAIETMNNTISGNQSLTPAERYRTEHDSRKPMDYLVGIEAFWVERKHKVRYTKDGVIIEVSGERYTYEVESERGIEDLAFRRKYLGDQFEVKYDPESLESIALYQSGRYIATANRKFEAAMARVDLVEGEGEIISKSLTQRKQYWQSLQQELAELDEEMAVLGFEPLNHRLIHKDAYNRMEGALLDELIKASAIPEPSRKTQREPIYKLHDDSEADGSILNK